MADLRALTVIQPWASCISHHGKHVENRTWPPPRQLIGQTLAIHAGKRWGRDERALHDSLVRNGVELPSEGPLLGAIVAVVTLDGWVRGRPTLMGGAGDIAERHGHLGVFDKDQLAMLDLWFFGPIGWMFSHVQPLARPVPCKGAQGLWRVPPEAAAEVERQAKR